jgi:DNA (cytosine-5)-methyltransferase 1
MSFYIIRMRKTINLLDLFSGIGGFHLGLERAGFKVNAYNSEIDKYAKEVYKHNFKDSTYVGSVTDVRGAELPRIDAITFGSPCQDFSLAGKREGMGGERSSLILEAIRLIQECRPRFFIWENVKGTFSSNNRQDFAAILQTFANLGDYTIEWQLLNTKWFLPQNRERIYLVGYLGGRSGQQVFPISEGNSKTNHIREELGYQMTNFAPREYYWRDHSPCLNARDYKDPKLVKIKTNNSKGVEKDNYVVAGTLRTHNDGKGFRETKDGDSPCIPARAREDGSGQPIININKTIRRLTPIECERLQGFPDNWTLANGISDTQRYKMCGNAVTVDVVEAVGKSLLNTLR